MSNKLNWEIFKEKLNESWWEKLQPFIESEECWNIYQELKSRGGTTYPQSGDTWNAFRWTNYEELKAIFVGLCPYHTDYKGTPYADGLSFSCSGVQKESPSLEVLYDAMRDDLDKRVDRQPDWHYIAFQDVLLLNTSLTTKKGTANTDELLWQPFMEYLWENVLDTCTGIPIITFGNVARETVVPYLKRGHLHKHVLHPAYYARKEEPMKHESLFSWINQVMAENNREEIYWDYADYLEKDLPF